MPPSPKRPSGHLLSDRLRVEAERDRAELIAALGQGRATFTALAEAGRRAVTALERVGFADDDLEPVRVADRVLRSAGRLIDDPKAQEVPPTNAEVYAAAVTLSEWSDVIAIAASAGPRFRDALAAALRAAVAAEPTAEELRLALSFAAIARRAHADARPVAGRSEVGLEIARWPVLCPCLVPSGPNDPWTNRAKVRTDASGRPAIVVIEAGPLLPAAGVPRTATDATATELAARRLDRCLIEHRDAWADAIGERFAFALAARATVPVVNAASGRVLFVQVWRCINLCALDDPRAEKLRRFANALARVDQGSMPGT